MQSGSHPLLDLEGSVSGKTLDKCTRLDSIIYTCFILS
jgi:hypothetical protein